MSQADDTKWIRFIKLAAVAIVIALCLAGATFLLNGTLRFISWGAATSLVLFAAAALMDGCLRRRPLDTSRAAVDAKARKTQRLTAIFVVSVLVLGPLIARLIDRLNLAWALCGFLIGAALYVALFFSPLFSAAAAPRPPVSPLSRMTSMEHAQRQNYE
jgi:hypothetical protein